MPVGDVTLTGRRAVLATMHRKEEVIGPALAPLGLALNVCSGLDTDRFGTFSGEVPRAGSQLEAARAKIMAAFSLMPDASVGIASEGSFAPDPALPIVPLDREIVLLIDRESGLELIGHHATWQTNFGHTVASKVPPALEFARKHGFPAHGMVVMACQDDEPVPEEALFKNLVGDREFGAATEAVIQRFGKALIQTDMRASWNPTRMQAIGRAAYHLVCLYQSRCPACRYPGYDVTERIRGLPCAWCGEPTEVVKELVLSCHSCGHRETRPAGADTAADPGRCSHCNPRRVRPCYSHGASFSSAMQHSAHARRLVRFRRWSAISSSSQWRILRRTPRASVWRRNSLALN